MFQQELENRIRIRVLEQSDIDAYHNLIMEAKDELKQWLTVSEKVATKEQTAENIAYQMKVNNPVPTLFMIEFENQLVGQISFHTIDHTNQSGEIGYWLLRAYQGHGIMTKALNFLITYGFMTLKLHRLEMKIAKGNTKSHLLAKRLGFRQEGVLKEAKYLNGQFIDYIVYGLLEQDK